MKIQIKQIQIYRKISKKIKIKKMKKINKIKQIRRIQKNLKIY